MLTGILRPFSRSGAILCYHGIATSEVRSPIHHTVTELETAVGVARGLGQIIPLKELVRLYRERKSTAGLFSITFDDAYLSMQSAAELFRREQVPVTVFAISDALDEGRRFWWDRLAVVLDRLSINEIRNLSDRWRIPETFRTTWSGTEFGPGWSLRQWIVARYAGRWPDEFEESLQELEQGDGLAAIDRSMTWEELASFAASGPIDIGVHTCSHAALSLLGAGEQRREIAMCHERLREAFPATVPILAAPFGLFNRDTVTATQEVGLEVCLGLGNRTLRFAGETGALPRFCMMHPESTLKLGPRLSGVFDHIRAWRGEGPAIIPMPPTVADSQSNG